MLKTFSGSLKSVRRILPVLLLGICLPAFCAAGEPSDLFVQYAFRIERHSGFLSDSEKEPLELFRRIGRSIQPYWPMFVDNVLMGGGFFHQAGWDTERPFADCVFARDWKEPQKKAAEKMFADREPLLSRMLQDVPIPDSGLSLKALLDLRGLSDFTEKYLQNPDKAKKLTPGQIVRIRDRILPLLQIADAVGICGSLSKAGLKMLVRLEGGDAYLKALPEIKDLPIVSTQKYVKGNPLLTFAQTHLPRNPADIAGSLREFPQMMAIEAYLASAGIDLEKDLTSISGSETLFTADLTPQGEGGLPNLHLLVFLRNPEKVLSLLPKLQALATKIGIFVMPTVADPPTVRVSHFLFPQFGLHFGLFGNRGIMSTSRDNILSLKQHMDAVDAGKVTGWTEIPQVQRYWRVAFSQLNEQVQKFLQSPILSGRGIPPVQNITVAEELGDLVLFTRLLKDRMEISVDLPVLTPKPEKGLTH